MMKRAQNSFISLLLLAAAVAPVSVSAADDAPKPKQAVIVLGMYEWMLADVLAHITGDELSVGSVMHSRRASYDDITRSSAVQAKVKALRRGASADLCALRAWGSGLGLSRVCLVKATQQNIFSAQLIDVKSGAAWCSGDYASDGLGAVELKKTAWALAERLRGGSCTIFCTEPEVVFVQGGTFTMGYVDGRDSQDAQYTDREIPSHSVTLSRSFWIGKYEVTRAQWYAVMGSYPAADQNSCQASDCPVGGLSYNDVAGADGYLAKLNALTGKSYRLPTEAEWEYAARGGAKSQNYLYSGGNDASSVAWHSGNSGSATHAVGTKTANELGIYDMSGNVTEFCSDWYGAYSSDPVTDPAGPKSGTDHAIRGGVWNYSTTFCRNAHRSWNTPTARLTGHGFRVALDVSP